MLRFLFPTFWRGRELGQLSEKEGKSMKTRLIFLGFCFVSLLIGGCNCQNTRIPANESGARVNLKSYASAQIVYKLRNQKYAQDLKKLSESAGLQEALAKATSPDNGIEGYYFIIRKVADPAKSFGLYAVPVKHGTTGNTTFYIGEDGVIYSTNLNGRIPDPATEVKLDDWFKE